MTRSASEYDIYTAVCLQHAILDLGLSQLQLECLHEWVAISPLQYAIDLVYCKLFKRMQSMSNHFRDYHSIYYDNHAIYSATELASDCEHVHDV